MDNEAKLRVGVFGVGSLGQHHARVYSELPGVELVGVFDVNPQRAAEVAARCRTQAFDSVAALAPRVQAASVVVPTDRHLAVFTELAAHGVHLLVEKPIAATTQEAEQMVGAARAKGLILQVGHIERFNPVIQALEANLGRPRFIDATRMATYPPARAEGPPRGTEVSVVLDLMIHDLEIILHLVRAPVTAIHAAGAAVLSPSEDIANARLNFANGCIANVTASRISRERQRKIRVFQDDSYLSLDYMNQTGVLCRKTATGIETTPVPITKGEPLANELAAFVTCVKTRGQPVVSGEQGWQALKLATEICRIIRENPS
jgi:predicted dehydrogenase